MQPDWEIWIDTNISPIIAKWMAEQTGLVVKSSGGYESNALTDQIKLLGETDHGNAITDSCPPGSICLLTNT
jgi:hypothetical protein